MVSSLTAPRRLAPGAPCATRRGPGAGSGPPGLARQAVTGAMVSLRAPPLAIGVLQHDDELVLGHALLACGAHVRRERRGGPALTGAGVLAELHPVLKNGGTGILTE